MEDGGGGKLGNVRKVLVLQVIAGVQAAAGQDGVLDAGGEDIPKVDLQAEIVQFLKKAAPRVMTQVLQVVPVGFPHGTTGLFHEPPANV